jgi:tetratricopeptide (TPR) repeat protein
MRAWRRLATFVCLAMVACAIGVHTQSDPRNEFVQALGRFSLALDGTLGDEGPQIQSSLDAMADALVRWDATIGAYEAAMAAEIGGAGVELAARMRVALAGVYLDRGRLEAALSQLTTARTIDPDRADVHLLLGAAYSQLAGDEASATDPLRKAAALDPGNPMRVYMLARHLARQERDEESRLLLRQFLETAAVRAALQDRTQVSNPFLRLDLVPERSDLEPFFPPVRYGGGFALLRRGDYPAALAAFRKAAAGDPLLTDAGPHREAMARGAEALRAGAIDEAIAHLESACSLAPDRAEPRRALGRAYQLAGEDAKAIEAHRRALRLDAGDERARLGLADALAQAGHAAEALTILQETLDALPDSGRARYAMARLHQRQGNYSEALRDFDRAVLFRPLLGLNGIYETMGSLYAARQDFEAAAAAYAARLELHPNDPDGHYDLGDMYLRQDRHDEALAEFTVALLLDPSHAAAADAMAQTHLRRNDYAAAAGSARRALAIDPERNQARYVLGTALMRLGQTEEGTRELETFRTRRDEIAAARERQFEVEGFRRAAAVAAGDGRHEEVVGHLRRVLALDPSAASHLELGIALLDDDQPGEALEHLNAAAASGAPYDVHRYLALAYERLGRKAESDRARAAYDRRHREALQQKVTGR